jgi:hypothetical protein
MQSIETFTTVATRATTDQAYRQRLLADPSAATLEHTGVPVPPSVRIKFIERDPDVDFVFVLPDPLASQGAPSLEELQAVTRTGNWSTLATDPCCTTL